MKTILGVEHFINGPGKKHLNQRLGLLTHSAALNHNLTHSLTLLQMAGFQVTTLFSPQHGIYGEKQDNMQESPHEKDPASTIQIYSLYSEHRQLQPEMVKDIDILLVDLQDVGTRVYTYIYTMALAMRTCAKLGIPVIVLDRPNPIGGKNVEGFILKPDQASFVGMYPIPLRHGMTIGELALFFKDCDKGTYYNDLELTIIPMIGWNANKTFEHTGLHWIMPSPNLPTLSSAQVYPGGVSLEGLNLSEGRGTTRPFEIFGAPFINPFVLLDEIEEIYDGSFYLRPIFYEPTFHKFVGKRCGGFQVHVLEPEKFQPVRTYLMIFNLINKFTNNLGWRKDVYEYEPNKNPFDLIMGNPLAKEFVLGNFSKIDLFKSLVEDETNFIQIRENYFIYSRNSIKA